MRGLWQTITFPSEGNSFVIVPRHFPFLCFLLPTALWQGDFNPVRIVLFHVHVEYLRAVVNAMALDRATDVFQQLGEDLD